ncbi:MAG: hypothetical protein HN353_05910 [Bdellovibrionales bacterium]|jgi:ubiquinone biosynthesis protein|nr:hypothetical protein [Bdellovibrionales bacterium]MBT3527074.1 hypothetical protein [Bdellovibrionales bacterium]MBT7670534.1 hypothetical protein [Bdellovibrionales bacterium]MBT7766460.1 hypothetical protein [Bdellovibrionales bacterium]
MGIIRTGIGIGKTIRNVSRLKEIVSVFAKNGFAEFMTRGITTRIPDFVLPSSQVAIRDELGDRSSQDWSQIVGYRLRLAFEELGPTFIKFGQLLSSREDIFDGPFIEEMQKLQDKVKGIPFTDAQQVIEKSLSTTIDQVFSHIEQEAIGTASIGVVYRGELKDGSPVVVKVRRPNIQKMIETDISILIFISAQIEKVSEEFRALGVSRILRDFAIGLQTELNFNMEAMNCRRLKENLLAHDSSSVLYIPETYPQFTSETILVMEYLDGTPFTNTAAITERQEEIAPKLEEGVKLFIKTFLQDGFFHADLHGGNFFLLKNGQIGLVDFGLMGTLGKRGRQNFMAIIYALVTYNFENLVYEFLDVAEYQAIPDIDALVGDIKDALGPHLGLTVQQVNFSSIMPLIINTLAKHKLYLPREWFIIFRAFIALDGVGKQINIDLDLFKVLDDDIRQLVTNSFNRDDLIEEGIWVGRDLLASLRGISRHFKWFVKDWSRNNYAFQIKHTGHEESVKQVSSSIIFLGFSILTAIGLIAGVLALGDQPLDSLKAVPTISWIMWGIALISFTKAQMALK